MNNFKTYRRNRVIDKKSTDKTVSAFLVILDKIEKIFKFGLHNAIKYVIMQLPVNVYIHKIYFIGGLYD